MITPIYELYIRSAEYLLFLENAFKKKVLNIFYCIFSQSFRLIMENNFIQMTASAGHAVAYTIGPIFKHTIHCVQLYFTNNVSEMFNCWERRWIDVDGSTHTLSATAAIFSDVRFVFGFSRFGLSMRMKVSSNFFSQDNENT